MEAFKEKVERLFQRHEELITRKNVAVEDGNGIFTRYKYPVVTAAHEPQRRSCALLHPQHRAGA